MGAPAVDEQFHNETVAKLKAQIDTLEKRLATQNLLLVQVAQQHERLRAEMLPDLRKFWEEFKAGIARDAEETRRRNSAALRLSQLEQAQTANAAEIERLKALLAKPNGAQ